MSRIELLAPAGDYNCFVAAINAGADAVYLSGEKYGARAYAKNFSEEELIKAIDFAHIFDRKVFLTVNTLVKDSELEELYAFLKPYYVAGLDGVIVQDMGVISYIKRCFKELPVHASTQLAITGLEGINLLANNGVVRTVLARELSLDEIRYIRKHSDMEIETFVHGALCYSYSGKCLFSSLVGGRSGNRGRCAGSCRQPYNNDKYLLSTKDICCLAIIPDLIDAGIASLKIEGRMKSPEYVAGVTSIYRKYIDLFYEYSESMNYKEIKNKYFTGNDFKKDFDKLTKLYTRGGNSEGYYYHHNDKSMITLADASYKSDKGTVKSEINENYVGDVNRIGISGYIRVITDEKLSILINNEFYYEGKQVLVAENKPTGEEAVRKQVNKTGDTEFYFSDLDIDISNNAFVRLSDLNELRRNALSMYKEHILLKYRRSLEENNIGDKAFYSNPNSNQVSDTKNNLTEVNCEVSSLLQLEKVAKIKAINGVYLPFELVESHGNRTIDLLKEKNKKVYIKFQSVIRYNFMSKNAEKIKSLFDKIDGVLCDSHEVLGFLLENDFTKEIIGDIHIYALNCEAANKYKEAGLSKLTVPLELNKKELISRNIKGEELICYGYLPMMISAQCVNNTINGCDKKYKEISLTDRKGAKFRTVNNCFSCSNVIYNNVPLSLQGEADFIRKICPDSIRLIFTNETDSQIDKICEYFTSFLENNDEILKMPVANNSYTKGHLNRGVL